MVWNPTAIGPEKVEEYIRYARTLSAAVDERLLDNYLSEVGGTDRPTGRHPLPSDVTVSPVIVIVIVTGGAGETAYSLARSLISVASRKVQSALPVSEALDRCSSQFCHRDRFW